MLEHFGRAYAISKEGKSIIRWKIFMHIMECLVLERTPRFIKFQPPHHSYSCQTLEQVLDHIA